MSGNLERVLRVMAERKASDVYISANSPILIRIDGQVSQLSDQELSASQTRKLLGELLTPQQLEEFDETGELNVGLTLPDVGAFRLSAFRQRGSIAAVFRFIPYDIPALDSLCLPESLADMVLEKHGLILVVGASGSGKSTTLAAMLDWRNQNLAGHILTIEDPIEYLFKHKRAVVNQREVGRDTAAAQTALRNALRQSPDCLLIGEIRDRETMSLALAYALSGHLVLATMHANNSYHALNRVMSFYPPEARPSLLMDLASGLKAVVSQRLLQSLEGGRVPAVEVLRNSRGVSELIDKGDLLAVKDAMEKAMAPGSQTFEQDLARLVAEGTVAREEALAFADSPTNLIWRLDNEARSAPRPSKPAKEVDEGATYLEYTIEVKPPPRGKASTGSTGWQVLR